MDSHKAGVKRKRPSSIKPGAKPADDELGGTAGRDSKVSGAESETTGGVLAYEDHYRSPNRRSTLSAVSENGMETSKSPKTSTSRRRRLIDTLATSADCSQDQAMMDQASPGKREGSDNEADHDLGRPLSTIPDMRSGTGNRRSTPRSKKIKLTYSQSRSSLGDPRGLEDASPFDADAVNDNTQLEPQTLSSPAAEPDLYDLMPDEASSQPAIRSVHELRRSGAINRSADEMDDLLIRIGKPSSGSQATSSSRRMALCELAQRLVQSCFAEQFRDHTCRDKIATSIGEEKDVLCGFALTAALVIFLNSSSAPNLVRQLAQQGLGKLLARLLRLDEEIEAIVARKRKKLSRTLVTSLHEVKGVVMQMPIWHGLEPKYISPRTLALRLLETVSSCLEDQLLQRMAEELGTDLATVAAAATAFNAVNYALTVSALEVLSSTGIVLNSPDDDSQLQRPQSVFKFLRATLENWPRERQKLDSTVLKLAINTTNTDTGAAAFTEADLGLLADRIGRGFRTVHEDIGRGSLDNDMYDELLLTLGVMINIVEHNSQARSSVNELALQELVNLWEENQPAENDCSQASSVEDSKLNVAISYLAVLLGYLCLTSMGRNRMKSRIGSLIRSIRDFVDMNKAVDGRTLELETLANELCKHASRPC
ncbi:hypothetical protein CDD80_640 [Ophiocordyceps camponoti-rufipedis]|uniref:Wings apart-like protein C-terminal domain-containing protein n=1 Tax=Ophiocordyceps camponoti-rufipedis TaxID=2004952 RepID=A0A2C5ZHY2_9HYPO|nr:hypothetical protein CDD80_640 [Ophiocordyceps camponoti-rufipedis]